MTARPKTKAARAARQISAVARHRLASQPAVMSLAASMATAMAITEFGEPGKRTTIPRIENQAAAPARATAAVYATTSMTAPWRRPDVRAPVSGANDGGAAGCTSLTARGGTTG